MEIDRNIDRNTIKEILDLLETFRGTLAHMESHYALFGARDFPEIERIKERIEQVERSLIS